MIYLQYLSSWIFNINVSKLPVARFNFNMIHIIVET